MGCHALAQPFADLGGAGHAHAGQHQHEFLAALACQHVGAAHVLAQQQRHRHQHLVAGSMAVFVVDALEVIDVDLGQRQRPLLALRRRQDLGAAALEVAAVAQSGQRVALGAGGELGRAFTLRLGVQPGLFGLPLGVLDFGARDEQL
jgi:hypothetical protein